MDLTSYLLGKKASGGGGGGAVGPDWGQLGYEGIPQSVLTPYNYALQIMNNWDATQTDLKQKFKDDLNLVYMPFVDTSNATNMYYLFANCNSLEYVPELDTSNVTDCRDLFRNCSKIETIPQLDFSNATSTNETFYGCTNLKNVPVFNLSKCQSVSMMFTSVRQLTDESLDNILQSALTLTNKYYGQKTLSAFGIGSSYYPAEKIQSLPHYQDFIDAGWTIGY